jgi:hypothetical protein
MGEFEARNEIGRSTPIETVGRSLDPGIDFLIVGDVDVVGDAEKAVALHLGPTPELRGNELAV